MPTIVCLLKINDMSQTTPKESYFSGFYNIKNTADSFTAKRKWKSFPFYILPTLIGAFFAFMWLRVGVIWPGMLALVVLYVGLAGLFNTITIKITSEDLIIKQGILPIPLSSTRKKLKDIERVTIDAKYRKTEKRVYSEKAGFHNQTQHSAYDLNAYFNDRRINLLAFKTTDIESAEYLKMKLHEFAIKANNGKYAPVN